jgi:signal transduction histidine kinase/AmiR/NasT family two-component response regulator
VASVDVEEKYVLQEIVNVANVGFVVIGPKLEIRLWNRWMVQATGIDSETACYQQADKLLPSIFTPTLIEKVRNAINMGIATSIPQADGDLTLSSQPVDITIQPLEARHYVHSLRPVREEVVDQLCLLQIKTNLPALRAGFAAQGGTATSEEEELVKRAEAERLNFLAMVGHQIRTPVNGVLGVAELLRDTKLTTEQRKYIDLLVRAGQSLQTFVNELTDLSYLEAGRVQLEEEVTDLPLLLQDVMGMFETTGSQKGLQAILEVASDVPKHVMVDHQKLQQVLAVLLNNAFKFTHKGGVSLKVAFRQGEQQPELLLQVSDTGVGIPDNRIGTLFEPSKPTVDNGRFYNRTGLGLFLCRELLELLGGSVKVESALEKGTTFSLVVPVHEALDAVAVRGQGAKVGVRHGYRKWRILLAEDNPVNQELFRTLLEHDGHDVTVVSNGQEAVNAVQVKAPFDIILMDIAMPVMDGLEATSLIRSLLGPVGKTPILALTAHALKGDREVFLNAGMDGYQSKPVEPGKLEEAIARAIASRKANRSWAEFRAPKQLARPANGPMSWLRFPGLNRPRGTDRADQ